MIPANDASGMPALGSKRIFTDAFIRNAHRILRAGYQRLDAPAYQTSEEDEITGDLAHEMNEVIGFAPESWMRMFQVHDQYPVTAPGGPGTDRRVGKRRSKIDLQFVANSGSGIVRFSWEAKRLGPGHAISAYLGPTGLGCYITGQYSSESAFGGMLGYAQAGACRDWYQVLQNKLEELGSKPESYDLSVFPTHAIRSTHARASFGSDISIYHTILQFN
jgi:hypothetical protein